MNKTAEAGEEGQLWETESDSESGKDTDSKIDETERIRRETSTHTGRQTEEYIYKDFWGKPGKWKKENNIYM